MEINRKKNGLYAIFVGDAISEISLSDLNESELGEALRSVIKSYFND